MSLLGVRTLAIEVRHDSGRPRHRLQDRAAAVRSLTSEGLVTRRSGIAAIRADMADERASVGCDEAPNRRVCAFVSTSFAIVLAFRGGSLAGRLLTDEAMHDAPPQHPAATPPAAAGGTERLRLGRPATEHLRAHVVLGADIYPYVGGASR